MVENRPWLTFFSHLILILGVVAVAFPLYVTFVASTLTFDQIVQVPMPLIPGDQLLVNYGQVLASGSTKGSAAASEAFFPFPDGLLIVAEAGATAIIQPGGAMKDDDVIDAADELGLAMVFTGIRHFRH